MVDAVDAAKCDAAEIEHERCDFVDGIEYSFSEFILVVAVGRNDPCPCGSGKRYKQCHGGLGAVRAERGLAPALLELMNAGLAHQQHGEYGEADRLYATALALDPDNFDILHMQGVVAYQRREFHRAEALIRRAIAINPRAESAHHNLTLVLNAHALENELCSTMLRALTPYCEDDALAGDGPVHLVTFQGAENESLRIYRVAVERALAADARVSVWRQQPDGTLAGANDNESAAPPRSGIFVFVGTRAAPGPWYRELSPEYGVIICHQAAACEVYDQIRAVTQELARHVHLWFASDAVARELGLPGGRGDPDALAAWLRQGRARKVRND
jgi:hypothetical protein